MRIVTFLFLFLCCTHAYGQNCSTIENKRIKIQILKKNKSNSSDYIEKIKKPNTTTLLFATGFNDSAIVYLNDVEIYNGYLKSEFSSGVTKTYIPLKFKKDNNILRVELPDKNECMIAKLKTSYKRIHIHKHQIWYVNYTNYIILFE